MLLMTFANVITTSPECKKYQLGDGISIASSNEQTSYWRGINSTQKVGCTTYNLRHTSVGFVYKLLSPFQRTRLYVYRIVFVIGTSLSFDLMLLGSFSYFLVEILYIQSVLSAGCLSLLFFRERLRMTNHILMFSYNHECTYRHTMLERRCMGRWNNVKTLNTTSEQRCSDDLYRLGRKVQAERFAQKMKWSVWFYFYRQKK